MTGADDPATAAGHVDHPERVGFFTDTSVCIGCKACEVACKEWNDVPDDGFNLLGMSFDNTGMLGANSWRHVAFVEQPRRLGGQDPGVAGLPTGSSGTAEVAQTVSSGCGSSRVPVVSWARPRWTWVSRRSSCRGPRGATSSAG